MKLLIEYKEPIRSSDSNLISLGSLFCSLGKIISQSRGGRWWNNINDVSWTIVWFQLGSHYICPPNPKGLSQDLKRSLSVSWERAEWECGSLMLSHCCQKKKRDLDLYGSSLRGYIRADTLLPIEFSPLRPVLQDKCLPSCWPSSCTLLSDIHVYLLKIIVAKLCWPTQNCYLFSNQIISCLETGKNLVLPFFFPIS